MFGGFVGDWPNVGAHVAFRSSEIRRPATQIVFAESVARNAGIADPWIGMHFVMPPRAAGLRWRVEGGQFVVSSPMITGLPKGRFGRGAVVGFFDGHVETREPADLLDMRLWAPRADRFDYDFVP